MSTASTTKRAPKRRARSEIDWTRFDAMTEAERHAAAMADPDAQPLTPEDFKRMKRTPQVKVIRRARLQPGLRAQFPPNRNDQGLGAGPQGAGRCGQGLSACHRQ